MYTAAAIYSADITGTTLLVRAAVRCAPFPLPRKNTAPVMAASIIPVAIPGIPKPDSIACAAQFICTRLPMPNAESTHAPANIAASGFARGCVRGHWDNPSRI